MRMATSLVMLATNLSVELRLHAPSGTRVIAHSQRGAGDLMGTSHLKVLRPIDRPNHHVIGQFYTSWQKGSLRAIYYCDSWVENAGYWMTNVRDPSDRRNISERAIDRGYHRLWADDPLSRNRLLYAEAVEFYNRNVAHLVLDPYQGFDES